MSTVDNKKDQKYDNTDQYKYRRQMTIIIRLEKFTQFRANNCHCTVRSIDMFVQLIDESGMHIELCCHRFTRLSDSTQNIFQFQQMIVLRIPYILHNTFMISSLN